MNSYKISKTIRTFATKVYSPIAAMGDRKRAALDRELVFLRYNISDCSKIVEKWSVSNDDPNLRDVIECENKLKEALDQLKGIEKYIPKNR